MSLSYYFFLSQHSLTPNSLFSLNVILFILHVQLSFIIGFVIIILFVCFVSIVSCVFIRIVSSEIIDHATIQSFIFGKIIYAIVVVSSNLNSKFLGFLFILNLFLFFCDTLFPNFLTFAHYSPQLHPTIDSISQFLPTWLTELLASSQTFLHFLYQIQQVNYISVISIDVHVILTKVHPGYLLNVLKSIREVFCSFVIMILILIPVSICPCRLFSLFQTTNLFNNLQSKHYLFVYNQLIHKINSLKIMDTFRVYSRCRPMNEYEQNYGAARRSVKMVDECTLSLTDGTMKQHTFQLDGVFDESTNNISIFNEAIVPAIQNVVNGINSTIFAYGITGAGKSFTMFGKTQCLQPQPLTADLRGIIPLTFHYLLSSLDSDTKLRISYLQIYNEQVFDLLQETQNNLQLSEDPIQGCVIVQDLTQVQLQSEEQVQQLISVGNSRRVIAQTKANEVSSRSHAIVIIYVEKKATADKFYTAKLSLVDLAGSQRQSVHSQTRGIRTFQGSNINRSLLTLGNCINILSQKRRANPTGVPQFIPYRDSKLTRLLKDSLGGNTKTVMIACISPSLLYYDQTLNTLKYACRANKIQKIVHQNIREAKGIDEYKKQIVSLKKQNQMLKMNLNMSLMLPGLSVGMAQQQNKLKKCKVAQLMEKLTKAIEQRVVMMSMSDSEQRMESIQNIVTMQQELKMSILQEFDRKPLKKGQSRNQNMHQIFQKKKNGGMKQVVNQTKKPVDQQLTKGFSNRQSQPKKPTQINNNKYKLSLKNYQRNENEEQQICNSNIKNKSVINLQNLRKKVMQDKKELSKFKNQIMQGLLTTNQIQNKAIKLMEMAEQSSLRFNEQQVKYLSKLAVGDIQAVVKQNFQSTKKKILNLANYSQQSQQSSVVLNMVEQKGVQNSRSRHLKSLNRIISLARVQNSQTENQSYNVLYTQPYQGNQSHYLSNISVVSEGNLNCSNMNNYGYYDNTNYECEGQYQQRYGQGSGIEQYEGEEQHQFVEGYSAYYNEDYKKGKQQHEQYEVYEYRSNTREEPIQYY